MCYLMKNSFIRMNSIFFYQWIIFLHERFDQADNKNHFKKGLIFLWLGLVWPRQTRTHEKNRQKPSLLCLINRFLWKVCWFGRWFFITGYYYYREKKSSLFQVGRWKMMMVPQCNNFCVCKNVELLNNHNSCKRSFTY